MSDHNEFVFFALELVIPLLVAGILVFLKRKYLENSDEYTTLDKIMGYPLLILVGAGLGVSLLSGTEAYLYDSVQVLFDIYQFLFIGLLILQIGLYVRYFREYQQSGEQIPGYMNWFLIVLIVFFIIVLLAMLEVEVSVFLLGVFFYVLGIILTILIIATGIAISPKISNFLSVRSITSEQLGAGLDKGDEITVLSQPEVRGTVTEISRQRIIIDTDTGSVHYVPKTVEETGYIIHQPQK